MRKLITSDVFKALRIIKCIGIKDELIELGKAIRNKEVNQDSEEIGMRLIFGAIANCGDAASERAIYDFLSGPLEREPSELANMGILELTNEIKTFINTVDPETWQAFFTTLSKLMQRDVTTSSPDGTAGR